MAMLAEPKRRQQWTLNPRGQLWANDDNKVGQKLLEKMGWSKGKGLGRKEQGEKDHILVRVKNNSKGLGYKGKDDEWIKHYEGFENVLATLNSENNSAATSPCTSNPNSNRNSDNEEDSTKVISLEARSKSSQARVHYHKFTRGKDLSRYNADDIACITGSKRSKQLAEAAKEDNFLEEDIGNTDHTDGITTVKGGNIQDYFAKKMALLKGQQNHLPEDSVGEGGEHDDNTEYVAQEAEYICEEGVDQEWENIDKCKEKKKRKKVKGIDEDDAEMREYIENDMQECEEKMDKKKKKKKRKMMQEDSQFILEENECRKKKTKVRDIEDSEDNETHCRKECSVEEQQKKKKKKKREMDGSQEENEEHIEIYDKESNTKEPRKKKTVVDVQENNCEETQYENEDYRPNVEETPKKKKKKVVVNEEGNENDNIAPHNDEECIAEKSPKKKKKKKARVEMEDDS